MHVYLNKSERGQNGLKEIFINDKISDNLIKNNQILQNGIFQSDKIEDEIIKKCKINMIKNNLTEESNIFDSNLASNLVEENFNCTTLINNDNFES